MPVSPPNPFPEITAFFNTLRVPRAASTPISVAVGVSGGADSVALLHILHQYRGEFGIDRIAAAHVNHGLRGAESDGDEDFARGEAEKLGVEFFRVRINADNARQIGGGESGLEAWARRERYGFFSKIRSEHGIDFVATAHTADDQAETVLMRLTRGAGLRGLRGILPVRGDGVIRPMLGVERRRLVEWLSARGVGYRVDSSNADTRFRRNRIRAEVIPKLTECDPSAVRNIAAAATAAQAAWEAVEGRVEEWLSKYALKVSSEIFHVEKAGLLIDDGSAPVRDALLSLFDEHGIPPTRYHIELTVSALLGTLRGVEHLLPGGWRMYCREDRVCFVKKDG